MSTSTSSTEDICPIAEKLFLLKEYATAAKLYEFFVDTSQYSFLTHHLIECYNCLGKIKNIFDICENFSEEDKGEKLVSEMRIFTYEYMGNLEKVKQLCKKHLKLFPDDYDIMIKLAIANFRSRNFQELDNFLENFGKISNLSLEDLITFSEMLAFRNMSEKALFSIYEMRRKFFNSPLAHSAYTNIFFKLERNIPKESLIFFRSQTRRCCLHRI